MPTFKAKIIAIVSFIVTYAWFASASTSTATMTITSATTSGWSLSKGTITSTSVTFSSQSTTLDLGEALAGLYSPNGELTLAPSANTATAVTVNKVTENFYACSTYNGKAYVTRSSQGEVPTVVRIVNGNSDDAKCTVTILVVLNEDNENTRYAAAGLTFYFADGAGNTYTLGYNYADSTGKTAIDTGDLGKAGKDSAMTAAKMGESTAVAASTDKAAVTGTRPVYDQATLAGGTSGFQTPTANYSLENSQILTANTGVFLQYSFTISGIAKGSGVNLVNYTWIDGWTANDAANGSEIQIYFAFGDSLSITSSAATAVS